MNKIKLTKFQLITLREVAHPTLPNSGLSHSETGASLLQYDLIMLNPDRKSKREYVPTPAGQKLLSDERNEQLKKNLGW